MAGLASVMGDTVDKFKEKSSEIDQLCSDLEKLLTRHCKPVDRLTCEEGYHL